MKILISGGTGFLGTALTNHFVSQGNAVFILTRKKPQQSNHVQWDGVSTAGWSQVIEDMDVVIHATGYGLEHWPWTKKHKQKFIDSRVTPGLALESAIHQSKRRPGIFIQTSGVNYYGLRNDVPADESTDPADDFLAKLNIVWEDATKPLEAIGVRRIILRNAVILDKHKGLFPLMTLSPRLFFGGRFGDGVQSFPWIHIQDYIQAVDFLIHNENANGPFNLIAPELTSNENFMRNVCASLQRPFWFHLPAWLLRMSLGEMSIMLTEGAYVKPTRLLELGYKFKFPTIKEAANDLLH